ncbi:MAG: STAS domain-containing protein [Methylococcales bacterium]|nr:STAS domain-containing protein [Methylococcales bacterium]
MSIQLTDNAQGIGIRIQQEMTIYTAAEQQQVLYEQLRKGKNIQIDLSGVTEIDSAGLQLLLWLKRESGRQSLQLRLTEHSEAVVEVFEMLDLSKFFGDPIVLAKQRTSS